MKTTAILDSKPEMPKAEADLKRFDTKPNVTLTPKNNLISGVQIETLIELDLIPEVMEQPEMSAAEKTGSPKLDNRIRRSNEEEKTSAETAAENKTSI